MYQNRVDFDRIRQNAAAETGDGPKKGQVISTQRGRAGEMAGAAEMEMLGQVKEQLPGELIKKIMRIIYLECECGLITPVMGLSGSSLIFPMQGTLGGGLKKL